MTRVAKYAAQSLLRSSGYSAEKITGMSRIFDIIAWDRDRILGLVIRSSKSKGVTGFTSLVSDLSGIGQNRLFPGDIELWILISREWRRYRVLPGGAMLCPGGFA